MSRGLCSSEVLPAISWIPTRLLPASTDTSLHPLAAPLLDTLFPSALGHCQLNFKRRPTQAVELLGRLTFPPRSVDPPFIASPWLYLTDFNRDASKGFQGMCHWLLQLFSSITDTRHRSLRRSPRKMSRRRSRKRFPPRPKSRNRSLLQRLQEVPTPRRRLLRRRRMSPALVASLLKAVQPSALTSRARMDKPCNARQTTSVSCSSCRLLKPSL